MLRSVKGALVWLGVVLLVAAAPRLTVVGERPSILGTWQDVRMHTPLGAADADIDLEFFGLGDLPDRTAPGVKYIIAARGGMAGASYQVARQSVWAGLRYAQVTTHVTLNDGNFESGQVPARDQDLRLAAFTPSLTLDTRDNFFTPTRGWYGDLSAPPFRAALGGDRDFESLNLSAQYFHPLDSSLYLGARGSAKDSSSGTPFYLRP